MLLVVFLFNVGGYYIVFWGLRYQENRRTTAQLDARLYSDEETILLKIPLHLPYSANRAEYKDVRGDFEHKNQFYKLVKQKLENDTLYIVCFKDHQAKHLSNTMIRYANTSNDFPSQSKQSQNLLSKLLKEYNPFHEPEMIETVGWCVAFFYAHPSICFSSCAQTILGPPPKA